MNRRGFTLGELVIVIVIMGVLAFASYPALSSLGSFGLAAAGRGLAADLEFVKSRAISTHTICGATFDVAGDTYTLFTGTPSTPLQHPLRPGQSYVVRLAGQRVDLVSATFGGSAQVRFDGLGQPLDGANQPYSAQGRVILARGAVRDTVCVDAFTGGVR